MTSPVNGTSGSSSVNPLDAINQIDASSSSTTQQQQKVAPPPTVDTDAVESDPSQASKIRALKNIGNRL